MFKTALEMAHDTLLAMCPNVEMEADNGDTNTTSQYGAGAVETFRAIKAALEEA